MLRVWMDIKSKVLNKIVAMFGFFFFFRRKNLEMAFNLI